MYRITYTPKQRRWHTLMKGVFKPMGQICQGTYIPPSPKTITFPAPVYSPRPSTIRKVIGVDYAEAELRVAAAYKGGNVKAFVPKHPAEVLSLIHDAQRNYDQRRRDIEEKYQQDIYNLQEDLDSAVALLYWSPPTCHTLLTKPWRWIYYVRRPTWMWNLFGPIAADYMAHRIWREFRHIRKLRYQRKQIPHVKRGYFDPWSADLDESDWFDDYVQNHGGHLPTWYGGE